MSSSQLLSPSAIEELKRLCQDPFIELGSMRGPEHVKCEIPHVAIKRKTLILRFPSVPSARKWNALQETTIRRNGHLVTAALGIALFYLTRSPAVGIAVAIAKDEIQASVWYPRMSAGWTLRREFEFRYQQFPVGRFEIHLTDVVMDEAGREQDRNTYAAARFTVDDFNGLPEQVARTLMTDLELRTVKTFR